MDAAGGRVYQTVRFGWRLLTWFFPPRCLGCGAVGTNLCAGCAASAARVSGVVCCRCGKPLGYGNVCPLCSHLGEIHFERARSVFLYESLIREAIRRFKFERKLELSLLFANEIFSVYLTQKWPIDLVVPTPISKARRNERGYNQTEWVARTFAIRAALPYSATGLQKLRETESQSSLCEADRRKNLTGAFRAEPITVRGKSVLVVDDVLTTGTTMNECACALKRAGAASVYGLTIAATKNRA